MKINAAITYIIVPMLFFGGCKSKEESCASLEKQFSAEQPVKTKGSIIYIDASLSMKEILVKNKVEYDAFLANIVRNFPATDVIKGYYQERGKKFGFDELTLEKLVQRDTYYHNGSNGTRALDDALQYNPGSFVVITDMEPDVKLGDRNRLIAEQENQQEINALGIKIRELTRQGYSFSITAKSVGDKPLYVIYGYEQNVKKVKFDGDTIDFVNRQKATCIKYNSLKDDSSSLVQQNSSEAECKEFKYKKEVGKTPRITFVLPSAINIDEVTLRSNKKEDKIGLIKNNFKSTTEKNRTELTLTLADANLSTASSTYVLEYFDLQDIKFNENEARWLKVFGASPIQNEPNKTRYLKEILLEIKSKTIEPKRLYFKIKGK